MSSLPLRLRHALAASALAFLTVLPAVALQPPGPPCTPCAGILVDDLDATLAALTAPPTVAGEARLYVAWPAELDGSADAGAQSAVLAAGGTPWTVLRFRTPAPVTEHLDSLQRELDEVARLAAGAGARAHFQIDWQPASGIADAAQRAFLLKRAAVAIDGAARPASADPAQPGARVLVGPLDPDPAALRALYAEDVAAYVDGIALLPGTQPLLAQAVATLAELDPGKPVTLFAHPEPEPPAVAVLSAARTAREGFAVTFFAMPAPTAETLAPLEVMAAEFQGDLSPDTSSDPTSAGGGTGLAFVRGEDLALRVVVGVPAGGAELVFPDPQLRGPALVDLATGESSPVFTQRRTAEGLAVTVDEGPIAVLRLERMSAAELEAIEETVEVETVRDIAVEEILRRLQAFEDAQARRLEHYRAIHTMHLRFGIGAGANAVEATFAGPFFYRQGSDFDWVWETLYINGVRWRGERLPEIPLIQPAKAAALPLEIHFGKEYRYRLRGTGEVDGRAAWIVDFEPVDPATAGPEEKLWQGTVWVDQATSARLRTRALQLGLEGDVLSNEETMHFSPVDAAGQPVAWEAAAEATSFVLPLRVVGQQILSVLGGTTQVQKETLLTAIEINAAGFFAARQAALESEATMVRDTAGGLRYLVKDEATGERVVQEDFDTDRLFLIGGTFYDSSLDYPLPLAGINYLDLDFRDRGEQVNLFFGGVLAIGTWADPDLFGSKWNAGANLFAFAIETSDQQYRGDVEVPGEDLESRPLSLDLFVGRPLGSFFKLDLGYELELDTYSPADDTDPAFVVPEDTLTHGFLAGLEWNRSGYNVTLEGGLHQRQDWGFWGLRNADGLPIDFRAEHEDFVLWKVAAGKSWWVPTPFEAWWAPEQMKLGLELEHLDGDDLDRFSKYDFSFFGDASVSGYSSGLVRAEEANAAHLSYGLSIGELFRIELRGDAAWVSDEASGFDNELLAGIGLDGTTMGPWETIVNFDIGFPVAGPAEDLVAYIVFLKLFR